ncbi:hypothetical protein CCS77_1446 [Campylobacter concisus]|uniref:Uncharacterized protein n=1 Tax=Campylobacter concisus TaxID=199 RepID=A0A2R4P1E6_9BACT|nr:hypothetical protein CCS77_1446 [Campylobacter concisus]
MRFSKAILIKFWLRICRFLNLFKLPVDQIYYQNNIGKNRNLTSL